jgi:hypothetical protein
MITFSQTSDQPYDRHKYKLYLTNGKVEQYEYYDEVQVRWFQTPSQFLSHIEVIDRKKKR